MRHSVTVGCFGIPGNFLDLEAELYSACTGRADLISDPKALTNSQLRTGIVALAVRENVVGPHVAQAGCFKVEQITYSDILQVNDFVMYTFSATFREICKFNKHGVQHSQRNTMGAEIKRFHKR
jgi:hypothetical protein